MRASWPFMRPAARVTLLLGLCEVASLLSAGGTLSAPCGASSSTSWTVPNRIVDSEAAVLAVAEAVNCTGGDFSFSWVGSIVVPTVITIGDGTIVKISGGSSGGSSGSSASVTDKAVVDGAGTTRLFFVSPDAELHLENVTLRRCFVGNDSQGGGGIYAEDSLVTMRDCNVVDNFHHPNASNAGGGGAVLLRNSSLTIHGVTTFSRNEAGNGGAICVTSFSKVTVIGEAVFKYNNAYWKQYTPGHGGAVAVFSSSSMTILGQARFSPNGADRGGAIYVSSLLNATGEVEFSGNEATFNGGAISSRDDDVCGCTTVHLGGRLSFFNNTAGIDGGAVSLLEPFWFDAAPAEGQFSFNSARGNGGAIAVERGGYTFFVGTISFVNNTSGDGGGAIALSDSFYVSTQNANKLMFVDNVAGVSGGAIFAMSISYLFLNRRAEFASDEAQMGGAVAVLSSGGGCSTDYSVGSGVWSAMMTGMRELVFRGNNASEDGGAVLVAGGTLDLSDCIFEGNEAGRSGGAVSISHTRASLDNGTFRMNTASVGPAVSNVGIISNEGPSDVTFASNSLACGDKEFIAYGLPTVAMSSANASSEERYDIDCDGCLAWHLCTYCVLDDDRVPACVAVPEHTKNSEPTGTVEFLELDAGFWRAGNISMTILACYGKNACKGGANLDEYCADGYEGPYCAACLDGYSPGLAFTCNDCSKGSSRVTNAIAAILLVVLIIAVMMIIADLAGGGATPVGGTCVAARCFRRLKLSVPFQSLKIAVVAWQIITQLSSVANVTYPQVYERFLAIVDLLSLDLGTFLATRCMISTNFFDQLLISSLGPIAALAVLACTYGIAMMRAGNASHNGDEFSQTRDDEKKVVVREKHASIALLMVFFVYGSVSSTVFGMFACEEFDNGETYLRADYSIRCDTARYRTFRAYAGFMVVLYPVGIPAIFGWLIFRYRNMEGGEENPAAKPFAELWQPYKPEAYMYELVSYLRRILLTGIVVFIFPNTTAQIAVTYMIEFVFFVVSIFILPYKKRSDSWLSHVSHVVVLATLYLALLLKVEVSDEKDDSQDIFAGVLVMVNCLLLLSIVAESLLVACQHMERMKPGMRIHGGASPVRESQGTLPRLPSCPSDVFLEEKDSSTPLPERERRGFLEEATAPNRKALPLEWMENRYFTLHPPPFAIVESRTPPPPYDQVVGETDGMEKINNNPSIAS